MQYSLSSEDRNKYKGCFQIALKRYRLVGFMAPNLGALPLLRSVSRDRTMKIFSLLSRVASVLVCWKSGPSNKVSLILQGKRQLQSMQ